MWRINHPSTLFLLIFHLLLYVAEVLSSLIDLERRPIRIEFLTLQGKPNTHARGTKSPMQQFPFLPRPWIRVTPLDYRVRLLCTRMLRSWELRSKRVKVKSTRESNQVLKLTDYPISWHVASTFKRLTTCTTHCDLIHFLSTDSVPWSHS